LTDSFERPDRRILDLRAKGYQSRNDRSQQKDDDNAPVPESEGRRRVDRPFQARMLCPENLEMRRIVVSGHGAPPVRLQRRYDLQGSSRFCGLRTRFEQVQPRQSCLSEIVAVG
jgi:hypothetical protein